MFRLVAATLPWVFMFLSTSATYGETLPSTHIEEGTAISQSPDGLALLHSAVKAIGHPEAFDAIESVELIGVSRSPDDKDGSTSSTQMLFVFPPDLSGLWMHSNHQSSNGVFVRTLAGDRSWASRIGRLSPELHADAVRYASTKLLTILRYREHPSTTIEWRGSEQVGHDICDLVAVTLFGHTSVLEIVRPSGRVAAIRFPSSEIQEGVAAQEVRRIYADYRQVGDLRVPFLQKVSIDGESFSEWQLTEFRFDSAYDSGIFEATE